MIKSFRCKKSEKLFSDLDVPAFRSFSRQARRRILYLDQAVSVDDLRVPPSNMLETLGGTRKGQWSIRINKKWRIYFRWEDGHAYDVVITDYH